MSESEVVCFHCTQPIGDPPRLNELSDGEVCPVCRDRLLEELPPIVHSPVGSSGHASQAATEATPADDSEARRGPRLVVDADVQGESEEGTQGATE